MKDPMQSSKAASIWSAMIVLAGMVLPLNPVAAPAAVAVAPAAVQAVGDAGKEIVYIDGAAGNIRVLDTVAGGGVQVQWVSPEADFREFALGDVNADGDMEIIGVKGDGTEAKPGKLVVYDPVKAKSDSFPAEKINGIPWNTLFTLPIPGKPLMVAAGNFDVNVTGDEFVVGYEIAPFIPPGDSQLKNFVIETWKNSSNTAAGRDWVKHDGPRYAEEKWNRVAVGQFVAGGADELGLVDEDSGKIEVRRLDSGFARLFDAGDTKKPFKDIAMGPWDPNDGVQVAGVRDVVQPAVSFYIWDWNDSDREEEEDPKSSYDPAPRRLAMVDVDGKGEKEIFLLRNLPGGNRPRLIVWNRGDDIVDWNESGEANLGDNEWRAITGGDLDGNVKEELVLGRADRIRVYYEADRRTDNKVDYPVSFNRRSLATGNLDALGFIEGPQFSVDKTLLEITTPAGTAVQTSVKLRNVSTTEAVPFSISADGNPGWLEFTPKTGSTVPNFGETVIQVTFNASELLPGIYRSRLRFDSTAAVANKPYDVIVTFTVLAAAVNPNPAALFFSQPISGTEEVQTKTISVTGTDGTTYTAAILGTPEVEAAAAQLGGDILTASLGTEGAVSGAGVEGAPAAITLGNALGDKVTLPLLAPAVQGVGSAAVNAIPWPSGVAWATASSADGVLPDTITVTVTPTATAESFAEATLVIFADARAGAPPVNVRFVPIIVMEVSNTNYMPIID